MATQEVGISIDLSMGEFHNTELKEDKLQLKELAVTESGKPIYAPSGYWVSTPIEIKDKIAAFERITQNLSFINSASYKMCTSSSNDGYQWSDWTEIDYSTGHISSIKNNYARLKIDISSDKTVETVVVDDFTVDDKYDNDLVNSHDGVLELKLNYRNEMTKLPGAEEGQFYSLFVNKTNYLKFDCLSIV